MKKSIRILFLLITVFIITAFTLVSAGAAAERNEEHTFVVEAICAEPSHSGSGIAVAKDYYSLKAYSGRYGNQLTGVSKEIYNSMVKQYVTDKKTTEYTYKFKTPFSFKVEIILGAIVSSEELEDIKYTIRAAMQMAQDAFLYDYPQLFWLRIFSFNYSVSTSGNEGVISKIDIIPYETYLGASEKAESFNAAVDKVIGSIAVTDSTYETLKNVHDYICENSWYYTFGGKEIYTSEPFFIGDGGMVCEGYSEAFKIICDRLDVPCALVVGDASGPHMWNYVQMEDGKWYLVDLTWDDNDGFTSYTYFIANANTIGYNDQKVSQERKEIGDFSETGIKTFTYPVLSDKDYVIHVHQWKTSYTVDKAPTCTEKGSKSIHCSSCNRKKNVTEIPATNHAGKKKVEQKASTCTKAGYTEGVYCPDCSKWLSGHKKTELAAHSFKSEIIKATLTKNGKVEKKCCSCGKIESATVYYPKTIKLSTTEYTFNGKTKTPTVTVKDSKGKVLNNGTDYEVAYEKGRKATGKYTVRVDFIGKYEGTKRLYFTIAPKAVSKVKSVQSTKAIKLSWNKVEGADGYRVYQYNSKTKKWDTLKTTSEISCKAEKLKPGTSYKFKIKAYKKDDGTIWGDATPTITVATKPATPKITKLTTAKGKAVFTWSDVSGESGYQVYYSTKKDSGFKKVKTYKTDVTKGSKSKLTVGKTYYFKVRAYKTVGDTKVYSAWSAVKSIKVK